MTCSVLESKLIDLAFTTMIRRLWLFPPNEALIRYIARPLLKRRHANICPSWIGFDKFTSQANPAYAPFRRLLASCKTLGQRAGTQGTASLGELRLLGRRVPRTLGHRCRCRQPRMCRGRGMWWRLCMCCHMAADCSAAPWTAGCPGIGQHPPCHRFDPRMSPSVLQLRLQTSPHNTCKTTCSRTVQKGPHCAHAFEITLLAASPHTPRCSACCDRPSFLSASINFRIISHIMHVRP